MTLQELYEAVKTDLENGYDPQTPVVAEIMDEHGYPEVVSVKECYWLKKRYWIGL